MSDPTSSREFIERLVKQSGIRKKVAAAILHALPEIIEEGLKRDGEVRVKGMGTFRIKWTGGRTGRNPKTGERVEIPAHNRLVFLPEQSFKDYINRDYRMLSYKIIPGAEQELPEEQNIPRVQPGTEQLLQSEILPEPEPESPPQNHFEPESQLHPQPEPELPARRRRIHWIIPVAISVIIILSLIFYLRNCYQVGSQRPAVSSQQSAADSLQSTVNSQQSAVDSQQSSVSDQQPADSNQNSELITQNSELRTQNSELTSPMPSDLSSRQITIAGGSHLFKLAREVYGNPYLWVLIYKANQGIISDPDQVIVGKDIQVPSLEGSADKLTRNDSLQVSEGYRLVYEYYHKRGDQRAEGFYKAMLKYKPL